MLYTSYYKQSLPSNILKVSISLSEPKGVQVPLKLHWLAPTWGILSAYKADKNQVKYTESYLALLEKKIEELDKFLFWAYDREVALLCWEGPTKFCHRHILADIIRKNFNVPCREYGSRSTLMNY